MPISSISKATRPFSTYSSFSKNILNLKSGINKMVNEHTVDYQHYPSELTSRIHPLIFLWTPERCISPEYFFEFFLKPVYPTMAVYPTFLWCWDYWKIHLWVEKLVLFIFTHASKQNSFSGSYHNHSRQKKITHSPRTTFSEVLVFSHQDGLDYGVEKNDQN